MRYLDLMGNGDRPGFTEPEVLEMVGRPARVSVVHCTGCGHEHGLGSCGHALRLTEAALRRDGGARFSWR
jgi:hypothetical protein